jgi:hypothetical protein
MRLDDNQNNYQLLNGVEQNFAICRGEPIKI